MTPLKKNVLCENDPILNNKVYLEYIEKSQIGLLFDLWKECIRECEEEEADGVIYFDVLIEKAIGTNLNDFNENIRKNFPVFWKYFSFVVNVCEDSKIEFVTFCRKARHLKNEFQRSIFSIFDHKDSDSEEDGEICFHCQ